MMKILLFISLSLAAFSSPDIRYTAKGDYVTSENKIIKHMRTDQTVRYFLNDFAEIFDKKIIYDVKRVRGKINIVVNKEIPLEEFYEISLAALSDAGYILIEKNGFMVLTELRKVRFSPINVYKSDDFPQTANYIQVAHQLKYPVGKSITKGLRPFVSRYGRILQIGEKSLVLCDNGINIKNLIDIVNTLDTKEAFEKHKKNVEQWVKDGGVGRKKKIKNEVKEEQIRKMFREEFKKMNKGGK